MFWINLIINFFLLQNLLFLYTLPEIHDVSEEPKSIITRETRMDSTRSQNDYVDGCSSSAIRRDTSSSTQQHVSTKKLIFNNFYSHYLLNTHKKFCTQIKNGFTRLFNSAVSHLVWSYLATNTVFRSLQRCHDFTVVPWIFYAVNKII